MLSSKSNKSIRIPPRPESKTKTIKTIDSRISINSFQKTIADEMQTPDQLLQIQQWHSSMVKKLKYNNDEESSPLGIIVKIQQISSIPYKKKQNSSKIFLKTIANLYNKQQKSFYIKSYESAAIQLHQTKNKKDQFEMNQPIAFYFYTYESKKDILQIKIEFILCQYTKLSIVHARQPLGNLNANPFSLNKTKQRQLLKTHLFEENKTTNIVVSFTITSTQSLKILYKLIPPNCLCGSQDYIPGLYNGGHLPYATNYFRLQYTSLNYFKLQVLYIEMAETLNFEIMKFSQSYFQSRSNFDIKQVKIKSIYLKVLFHNGWKTVNQTQTELLQKRSRQVKNKTTMYKALIFQPKNLITLPFVFLESEAIVCLQLIYNIESISEKYTQSIDIAIACCNIPLMNAKQITRKKLVMKSGPYQSITNQLPILANPIPIKLEYDMHLAILDNIDSTRVQGKNNEEFDRIQMQKSRIIQQKKKVKWQRRKIQMQLTKQPQLPNMMDVIQQTYIQKIANLRREKDHMFYVLEELRHKVQQYQIVPDHQEEIKIQVNNFQQIQKNQPVFYQALLEKPKIDQKSITSILPYILQTEEINEQIIRNELVEFMYCNCIMLNFLTIHSDSHKLPRKLSFQIQFFNHFPLKTKQMTPNTSTGELLHISQTTEPNQKQPVYNFQIQPHTYTSRQHYLNYLLYLQRSKLQLIIIDQDSSIQFGYAMVPLKDLIRRRRQQVKIMIESEIFIKDILKGHIKLQICNIRQQPKVIKHHQEKIFIRNIVEKGEKLKVVSNQILVLNKLKKIEPIKIEISGQQRLKQRIKNFKQNNKTNSPKKQIQNLVAEYKDQKKLSLVEKVLQQNVLSEKIICPIHSIPQIIHFEFSNENEMNQEYRISIIDPDQQYLSGNLQFSIVKQKSQAEYWIIQKYIDNIQPSSIKTISEDNTFQLQKNQKITLIFKYQSFRRFGTVNSDDLIFFNREHIISVCISIGEDLIGIYKIRVIPEPDIENLCLTYFKQENSNADIILPPFCPSNYSKNLQISFNYTQMISQWVQNGTQLKLSLVTPKITNQPNFLSFFLLIFQDQTRDRFINKWNINIISCQKIIVNGELGITSQRRITLDKSIKKQVLVVYSEDQKVLQPSQVSHSNDLLYFRLKVTPNFVNTKQFLLNVKNIKTKEIVKRYIIQVNSQQPIYKHIYKINHNKSLQKVSEQFQYINPLPKKTQYEITTTNPYLLKPEENKLQILANKGKQFKLLIMSPLHNIEYAQVTLSFVDKQQQIRQFMLFKITYS